MNIEIQPYFAEGERYPALIGVRVEGDEYQMAYVSKVELADALADNAKLRELVSGLEYCVQGYVCDSCPLYDPSGTNHRRCESLERDIGVEVDE